MPLLQSLLRQAFALMRDRPLAQKIGAVVLALLVPLLVLLSLQWQMHQRQIHFAQKELSGLHLVQQVMTLAVDFEHLRAARSFALSSAGAATWPSAGETEATAARVTESLKALRASVAAVGDAQLVEDVEPALASVERVLAGPALSDPRSIDAAHGRAAITLRELNLRLAEHHGLLFDPQAPTYLLMDLAVERVMLALEASGRASVATVLVLQRGEASSSDRERVQELSQQARERVQAVRNRLEALKRAGYAAPDAWADSFRQADDAALAARAAVSGEFIATEPREMSASGQRALQALALLQRELLRELRGLLEQRMADVRQTQWIYLVMVGAAMLIAAGIAWVFVKSFVGSTRALVKNLQQASSGNLTIPIYIRGKDEIAEMGVLVEGLCRNMSALVGDIRTSATRLGEAGQTVASEGVSLAQRTDAQACSLRQSVDVMEHLVGQVSCTADGIVQISTLTEELHQQSKDGNIAMMTAVQSMDCLQASAKRIAEINGVIDDIAFQTNLVALNASVEAAKAGESGRGFSVVAAEIRQLAQRCVAAAAEVRDLIDTTSGQVETTSGQIQTVGSALINLQTGVEQVLDRLHSVANASAEQSAGLEQVSAEIISLQGLTQEGAAAVERCENAAAALMDQAAGLSRSVKPVRLRQGSADEAKNLVLRAKELVAAVGWENAAEEFNEEFGPWHDRGMYIFAWDDEGVCLAYGVKPQWVGRNIYEFPNGSLDMVESFLKKAFDILKLPQKEGWVDYRQLDPHTMLPVAKSAYIVGLAGGGFMGCSVTRHAADDAPDAACATLTSPMTPEQAEALCATCDQADECAGAPASARQAEARAVEMT